MNIKGHQRIREFLAQSLAGERTGHAYLFAGRRGIGKRLVALEFSLKLLEAEDEKTRSRILKGLHPDFKEMEPEKGSISIEKVREAQEWLSLAPMEGRRKVLLVNEAHAMTREGANAFLKTLEEPPQASVILLVTSMANQLLPTILSRCIILRFSPLSPETVEEILLEKGIEPARARESAHMSQGSVAFAMELAQGQGKELLERAKKLYQGNLPPLAAVEYRKWKQDKETVMKYLGFLRTLLRSQMERKIHSHALWEKHKLLARVEENLYQYNLNPQLTLEYLELKWKSLDMKG